MKLTGDDRVAINKLVPVLLPQVADFIQGTALYLTSQEIENTAWVGNREFQTTSPLKEFGAALKDAMDSAAESFETWHNKVKKFLFFFLKVFLLQISLYFSTAL